MFPLRGAENDIQNHLLFFIFLGKVPLLRMWWGDFVFFAFIFGWWLSLAATLRWLARFNGFFVVMRTLL